MYSRYVGISKAWMHLDLGKHGHQKLEHLYDPPIHLRISRLGAGERAPQLSMHTTFAKSLSLVLGVHAHQLETTYNSSPGHLMAFSDLTGHLHL